MRIDHAMQEQRTAEQEQCRSFVALTVVWERECSCTSSRHIPGVSYGIPVVTRREFLLRRRKKRRECVLSSLCVGADQPGFGW